MCVLFRPHSCCVQGFTCTRAYEWYARLPIDVCSCQHLFQKWRSACALMHCHVCGDTVGSALKCTAACACTLCIRDIKTLCLSIACLVSWSCIACTTMCRTDCWCNLPETSLESCLACQAGLYIAALQLLWSCCSAGTGNAYRPQGFWTIPLQLVTCSRQLQFQLLLPHHSKPRARFTKV